MNLVQEDDQKQPLKAKAADNKFMEMKKTKTKDHDKPNLKMITEYNKMQCKISGNSSSKNKQKQKDKENKSRNKLLSKSKDMRSSKKMLKLKTVADEENKRIKTVAD